MIYLSKPQGTHAVFPTQQGRNPDYHGAFDIIRLRPGADYVEGYPNGDFIGNRQTLDEAREWADACEPSVSHHGARMVPFRLTAKRTGMDSIEADGWNEDGTGEGPTIALSNASALGLVAEVASALNSEAPR